MPPTPIPDGFGEAVIRYQNVADGQVFVTTFGFDDNGVLTPDNTAAQIRDRWLLSNPSAGILNSYIFTGCHVLMNRAGVLMAGDAIAANAGTVAAAAVSPAVSMCVTKRTAAAGRKFRGRMYLPPAFLSEANVDTIGQIDAATKAGRQGAMNALLAGLTADLSPMVLLHRDLTAPTVVTSLLVRTSVRTQKRRQASIS